MRLQDLRENRERSTAFYRDAQGTWTFDPLSFAIPARNHVTVTVRQVQRSHSDRPGFVRHSTISINRSQQTWSSTKNTLQSIDEHGFPQGAVQQQPDTEPRPWQTSRLVQELIKKLVAQRYIETAV